MALSQFGVAHVSDTTKGREREIERDRDKDGLPMPWLEKRERERVASQLAHHYSPLSPGWEIIEPLAGNEQGTRGKQTRESGHNKNQ